MKRYITLYAMLICFLAASSLQAEFPSTINYQGRLVSGAELVNAMVEMRFRLYAAPAGGELLFESTNQVLVVDGLYTTEIGENAIHGTLQEALKNYPVFLEVEVDGDILSPRERLAAVPYALKAAPPSQGQNVSIIDSAGVETFFPSITNAFEQLESGQTLRLYPGDHYLAVAPVHGGNPVGKAGLLLDGLNNVRIEGVGNARLYSDQYGDYLFIRNSHNIDIEGITFDGAGPNPASALNFAMINFSMTNSNIRIRNCRFTNYGRHGISHLHGDKTTTHVVIQGNYFENGGDAEAAPILYDDGAAVSGIGSYWSVVDNHINNCLRGIEIEGPGPSPQKHIIIANNVLRDMWSAAIMLFPSSGLSGNYTDIIIKNNAISGHPNRPEAVTYAGSAVLIRGGERILIQGNVVDRYYVSHGVINLVSENVSIHDCIITDNIIFNGQLRGIQLVQRGGDLTGCLVSGNNVIANGDRGIIVSGTGHSIINNVVMRNTAGSTGAGIQIYKEPSGGPTDRIFIAGNHSYANRYGLHIREDVGGNIEIGHNYLHSNSDADFLDLRE